MSLIWPKIKNTEAGPIWGILIKKYLVYVLYWNMGNRIITKSDEAEMKKKNKDKNEGKNVKEIRESHKVWQRSMH